jgi:hypothetical protein
VAPKRALGAFLPDPCPCGAGGIGDTTISSGGKYLVSRPENNTLVVCDRLLDVRPADLPHVQIWTTFGMRNLFICFRSKYNAGSKHCEKQCDQFK